MAADDDNRRPLAGPMDPIDRAQWLLAACAAQVDEIERELDVVRASLRVAREERRMAVAAARMAGVSYGQIAATLGVSPQRARALAADAVYAVRRRGAGAPPPD